MRIFWEKNCRLASPPNPRLIVSLRPQTPVVTPVYYYNFVEFVSSAKCILFRSKNNQVTTIFCLSFFRIFAPIFSFKLCKFCWRGAQEYILPQGAGYPSYATEFYGEQATAGGSLSRKRFKYYIEK